MNERLKKALLLDPNYFFKNKPIALAATECCICEANLTHKEFDILTTSTDIMFFCPECALSVAEKANDLSIDHSTLSISKQDSIQSSESNGRSTYTAAVDPAEGEDKSVSESVRVK